MKKVFLIAEIGQAHDGSLGIAHSYIDALSKTGVDAVKFQTHIPEAESSIYEPFRVPFSYVDKTRYEYWERTGFSLAEWKELKNHCNDVGIEFMSSPFSLLAVDWLEEIGVNRYKIASGEVSNLLMLEKITKTHKPIILSSGMSSYDELDKAVELILSNGNELSILQCTTSYPTPYDKLGLNVILELQQRFPNIVAGLSDHTGNIFACIAAVTLGAKVLEFHAVFDKQSFGPDSKSSLVINEICQLVEGVRSIEVALSNPVDKSNISSFNNLKKIFEKSLAVNKEISPGHILTFEDLESKKPANHGIPASLFKDILGKKVLVPKNKFDFLNYKDLSPE